MHKKTLVSGLAVALMASVPASAFDLEQEAEAKLSLTDGIIINKENSGAKEVTQETLKEKIWESENAANAENEPKKGFLSFLNFSFFDKKEHTAVKPEKDEEPVDFLTRITNLADDGDINALITLGYMYLYGLNGVEMNYKKAFEYYQQAAEQGDHVAINNLGSMYYGGVGIRKNIEKAAELFAEASDLGNIEATVNLAVIYLTHPGKLRNEQAATLLLKKAAEHDNPTGRYLLGYCYLKGIGVPQNKKKAVENIRFAADKGYDEAQFILGHLYVLGWGVPQNYNNALRYLNRAVNQGNLSAIQEVGTLYASGDRLEPNFYKAYIMYNLASYYGIPGAEEKRDVLSFKGLKKPEVLQAQTEAENFKPNPTELTKYIRATFGKSLALYVDPKAPIVILDD